MDLFVGRDFITITKTSHLCVTQPNITSIKTEEIFHGQSQNDELVETQRDFICVTRQEGSGEAISAVTLR